MNIFDLILATTLVFFIAVGLYRGFIKEVLSLVAWVLAAAAAWFLADKVGSLLASFISEPTMRVIAGFVVIFLVVFIITAIAKHYLHQFFMSRVYLKVPNFLLGAIVGGFRGGFVVIVVFILAGLTPAPQQSWWRSSQIAPHIEPMAIKLSRYLPRDVARHIRYG